jgi:hypothetical protein
MKSNKNVARVVGVLFIIGTVAGILSVGLTASMLGARDYLTQVSANGIQMTLGAICVLIMGFSLAMVPVVMYPIFKKQNEALALGYVVFRGGLETVTYIALVVSWLLLITLSQHYVAAGASDGSFFQTSGALLQEAGNWIGDNLTIIFSLGALMLYWLLYQSKLVPRWLSIWGLIVAVLYLASGLLALINPLSTIPSPMQFPMFLQEMVMAIWLIVKGFNASASVFQFAKAE